VRCRVNSSFVQVNTKHTKHNKTHEMANNNGVQYTQEEPYRLSFMDPLYPQICVHQWKTMRDYIKARGSMWILILGMPAKQYASIREVKGVICAILCAMVESEGDQEEMQRRMPK